MRPFTDVLGELAGGTTLDKLTADMAEIVAAVRETGAEGKLTLALTVKPNGIHGVEVVDKITTKVPSEDRGTTLFFTDVDGGVHRRDPRQTKLPLHEVATHDPETGEVKT